MAVLTLDEVVALAAGHQEAGRLDQAERFCRAALAYWPAHAAALRRLALIRQAQDRPEAELTLLERATGCGSADPLLWTRMGLARILADRVEEGLAALAEASRLAPSASEPYAHQALGLIRRHRLAEAEAACAAALRWAPADPLALKRLALLCIERRQFQDALVHLSQALAFGGGDSETLVLLGRTLMSVGMVSSAARCFRRALACQPRLAEAWRWLAGCLLQLSRPDQAAALCRRALLSDPAYQQAASSLVFALNYDPLLGEEAVAEAHRDWGRRFGRSTDIPPPAAPSGPERPLRVGYVSGDLVMHPVGRLLEAALAHRIVDGSTVTLYATQPHADRLTDRLRARADAWRDVSALSHVELDSCIRGDGIDVLVDLSGHTGGHRLLTFARRPAPVQASWLGYFHTTGLAEMDYVILDPHVAPPGADALYVERIVRLPHSRFCYTPPDDAPPVACLPARAKGSITFGSFNVLAKLNDAVVALWAMVLHAVPGSRLLIKSQSVVDPAVQVALFERFGRHGIAGTRLELRSVSEHAEMLAEYGEVDIALDPFPFTGGMTSLDSLWMGVPVVTWPGPRPVSRQTLGFLACLGLTALAADSPRRYAETAIALAGNLDRLAGLRASLRERMRASPLCDGPGFARALDAAYRTMWRRRCAGLPPEAFAVG